MWRVMKEWVIDWEEQLPANELETMLDVIAEACYTLEVNINMLKLPEDDDYIGRVGDLDF